MKHLDYLYFNIYSYFYRSSQDRLNFNPRMQTMYLFSLGSGGWLLLLESLYLHVAKRSRFASPEEATIFATSVYMLTAVLFGYIFIMKERDLKIFGKYEELSNRNPKQKRHFIISISILVLPYLGLLSLGVIFSRHGQ
jgi:hypothetical protein